MSAALSLETANKSQINKYLYAFNKTFPELWARPDSLRNKLLQ
jgi:hypothetical protein